MTEQKMRIAWVVSGAYFVIILECATMGVIAYSVMEQIYAFLEIKVMARDAPSVIVVTFVAVCVLGWLLSMPGLCHGIQAHSDTSLVPYLVWRMLFNVIIAGAMPYLMYCEKVSRLIPSLGRVFSKTFHNCEMEAAIGEILVGILFFCIVQRAYREFSVHRLQSTNSFRRD
ncbi:hypothetical protein PRIPAC_76224 [Pristionchus pacificus]|uniref:Uncharacterized protein n=1 Tax=Pristionchus pacificus TaxID=54126 RepID=A0A2A6B5F0_PRIPA|nr:hypothetical protein PRIPAC_76224 [Pristionchus pacificus]|eukprot:PDM61083.1 hypothetical protein PRIPAC_54889 [Pristionchus pacificus]